MRAAQARVVLTGAAGGIGQAAARRLAAAGAALLLVGRSPGRLAAEVRALAERDGAATLDDSRLAWHAADLTRTADVAGLAAAAARWQCNVLVHGAGVPAFGPLEGLEASRLDALVATNLVAPIRVTQALLEHLRRQPQAQVICIGSALGRIGLPGFAAYGASKAGLRGFAEALRRELAGTTVRVQYLGPRSTHTAFNDRHVEAYLRATGSAVDPPERVAEALLHLLEDERPERYVGYPESLVVRLNALVGPWLDGAFARHRRSLPPASR